MPCQRLRHSPFPIPQSLFDTKLCSACRLTIPVAKPSSDSPKNSRHSSPAGRQESPAMPPAVRKCGPYSPIGQRWYQRKSCPQSENAARRCVVSTRQILARFILAWLGATEWRLFVRIITSVSDPKISQKPETASTRAVCDAAGAIRLPAFAFAPNELHIAVCRRENSNRRAGHLHGKIERKFLDRPNPFNQDLLHRSSRSLPHSAWKHARQVPEDIFCQPRFENSLPSGCLWKRWLVR